MDRTAVGRACAILGTVALLATVGCGDDGNDGESSAQESSSSTTAPPTGEETTDRDEYVERANEGCEEAIAEFSELAPELGENPTDAEIVAFAEVLVELNRAMVTVFEELPVPEGDEDVIRSIIDGSIEATDELEVLGILGGDMRRLLRRHPDMAVKLVIALGRRLRAANERLARQSFQTVQSRVAAVLAQLVDQAQSEGAGARDIPVVATQADLAKLAGSSRESASRFLAVLERAGVISQGRGRLTVHDPGALQGYVY